MLRNLFHTILILSLVSGLAAQEKITSDSRGLFLTEPVTLEESIASGQTLEINSVSTLAGNIKIETGGNQVKVTYHKQMKTSSKGEAESYAHDIEVELTPSGEGFALNLMAPSQAPWSGTNNSARVNLEISIPENCHLVINTTYFDIDVKGPLTTLQITESLSEVTVDNVIENTNIKVSNRPLVVKNTTGTLNLSNQYSRIEVANINATGDGGEIRNDHGDIFVNGYTGPIDVRTSYDRLIVKNLFLSGTRNTIRNVSAMINVEFDSLKEGECRIINQYGDIGVKVLGPVDAQFICKNSETGRIYAKNLDMRPSLVYDNRLEFGVGDESAELRITARGDGNITIDGPE